MILASRRCARVGFGHGSIPSLGERTLEGSELIRDE